jgi:hypothetical protein
VAVLVFMMVVFVLAFARLNGLGSRNQPKMTVRSAIGMRVYTMPVPVQRRYVRAAHRS